MSYQLTIRARVSQIQTLLSILALGMCTLVLDSRLEQGCNETSAHEQVPSSRLARSSAHRCFASRPGAGRQRGSRSATTGKLERLAGSMTRCQRISSSLC
jgi:hypothetical protein